VLDAPGDVGEQADQDAKWEVIARQAAAMSKKFGALPGHWQLELEKRNTPTEDWRATLREFFEAGAQTIQTFSRPNKRFSWSGTIIPGNQREGVNKVVFLLDTSGSMMGYLRNSLVANEVNAAMDAGLISEAVVLQCDTQITDVARYVNGDKVDLEVKGLGGTDMKPGFQWIEDNEPDANLIVCLTDMEIPDPGPEPAQHVLWCHYGLLDGPMAAYKHKPAFGRVIDVGSDV
jgi:predicted metal-dependent peptidase